MAKSKTPAIYQELTDKIITLLENVNVQDYQAPFSALAAQGLPMNPTTQNHYQGANIPCLWFYQQEKNYASNQWATFKQWKQHDATVRIGEKASPIIFYKTLVKSETNDQGEKETVNVPMLRLYSVFNANQVDGYTEQTHEEDKTDLVNPIALADQFCANTKATIQTGEGQAYYSPSRDVINLPSTKGFIDTADSSATQNYYSVLLHELTHWTGSSKRLNRTTDSEASAKQAYAFEELIAELGAAFLCAQLGISQSPREDHAHYIKSWLQALKNDNKHIFKASAQAARAVEYLNDFQ